MTSWWELAIPAAAGVLGGLGGAAVSGWFGRSNTADAFEREAEERRRRHFLDDRRSSYVRFLAALREWEPRRDRDWKMRAAADNASHTDAQRDDAMRRWRQSREESEPYFRKLIEAQQEILLLAPRHIRDLAISLVVESSRGGKTGRLMEEFLQAVRFDLGTDPDLRAAGSPLLETSGVFQDGVPSLSADDQP
ncbi:hypothetical protein [Phytomonospora endophytica]|uniref:Uncharacterized protein n=1 Tax=Phytomonospora endophytica TaxID=714109 RepID=A0A841FXX3_9ACTN|nr:hypothetical protein [Phytomonospora endophytica]MBB6038207.1 hypothetical protein [Phytomonospora endophytica]GIG67334.1 hypothetical protein Pen01_36290 [Phytomonospora endophytica]